MECVAESLYWINPYALELIDSIMSLSSDSSDR